MTPILFEGTYHQAVLNRVGCVLGILVASWALAGCIYLGSESPDYETGQFIDPTWQLSSINEHLQVLSDIHASDVDEAVRYATSRLREYRVQPGFGERYRPNSGTRRVLAVGMIGGRNPQVSDEAVLVSADITDQIATSAWLELARLQASFARSGILPERSVLFVLWQGGSAGLRDFLRSPPWLPSEIKAWIYLHPPEHQETSLRELARKHGWRYHLVYSDLSIPGEIQGPVARRLAERAHSNIRAEVLSEGAFLPIRPHILVAPPDMDEPSS